MSLTSPAPEALAGLETIRSFLQHRWDPAFSSIAPYFAPPPSSFLLRLSAVRKLDKLDKLRESGISHVPNVSSALVSSSSRRIPAMSTSRRVKSPSPAVVVSSGEDELSDSIPKSTPTTGIAVTIPNTMSSTGFPLARVRKSKFPFDQKSLDKLMKKHPSCKNTVLAFEDSVLETNKRKFVSYLIFLSFRLVY